MLHLLALLRHLLLVGLGRGHGRGEVRRHGSLIERFEGGHERRDLLEDDVAVAALGRVSHIVVRAARVAAERGVLVGAGAAAAVVAQLALLGRRAVRQAGGGAVAGVGRASARVLEAAVRARARRRGRRRRGRRGQVALGARAAGTAAPAALGVLRGRAAGGGGGGGVSEVVCLGCMSTSGRGRGTGGGAGARAPSWPR